MHLSTEDGHCIHFADDTAVVFGAKTSNDLCTMVNKNLMSVSNYCKNNHLKINATKTVAMLFNICKDDSIHLKISINGSNITLVDTFNYLGYRIDSRLSFQSHVEHVSTVLSRNNAVLQRTRVFLPISYRLRIFRAISMCHLHYCSLLFVKPIKKCFIRLHRDYKNAGCIVFNCYPSALPMFKWPDLNIIFEINKYVFLYKVINMNYSPVLRTLLHFKDHDYNTRHHADFKIYRFMHSRNASSFIHWAPRVWNSLPIQLKSINSLAKFKKGIHEWLLNREQCY
jgi:hypothetical protein